MKMRDHLQKYIKKRSKARRALEPKYETTIIHPLMVF